MKLLKKLKIVKLVQSFLGSVMFYTCIPLPQHWKLEFQRIARWTPVVGLLIGGGLGLIDWGLQWVQMPILTRSVLVVALWVGVTGGLHLDGVSDTADGLAVQDPQKRLAVMQDSVTGAFGVMAVALVLLLKTVALIDLFSGRWLALMVVAGWGRWGQVMAIALYPYLKPTGKGAFHKQNLQTPQDVLLGLFFLLGLSGVMLIYSPWWKVLGMVVLGGAIALLTGFWFYSKLGGHTGDTYGAVVEWSETLILCFLTPFW